MLFAGACALVILISAFILYVNTDASAPMVIIYILLCFNIGMLLSTVKDYDKQLQQYNCVAHGGSQVKDGLCLTDDNVLIENWDQPKESND